VHEWVSVCASLSEGGEVEGVMFKLKYYCTLTIVLVLMRVQAHVFGCFICGHLIVHLHSFLYFRT